MSTFEKMQKCHEFVIALEEERRKIQVFQRELPLCLELVTQAIETYKRELSGTTTDYIQGNSDCSDQTSTDPPVLEEFIPISRGAKVKDDEDDDVEGRTEEQRSSKRKKSSDSSSENRADKDDKKKSDWLRSAQLWKEPSDPSVKEEEQNKGLTVEVGSNRKCGAFQPFQRDKNKNDNLNKSASVCPCPSSSAETVGSGGTTRKDDKESNQQRKQRRCWSPELHRRFLQALQQLGGSHVATPKQIRELMKVDGLTNDEVKSHLQKYRLHSRRPSPTTQGGTITQPPQFVVVGGIWVPPPEYSVGNREVPNGAIYAPIASTLTAPHKTTTDLKAQESDDQQLLQISEGDEGEGDGAQSDSISTSSCSRTTTSSPIRSV